MQTVYIGNTLINDVFLGSQQVDDVLQIQAPLNVDYLIVAGGGAGGNNIEAGGNGGGGGAGGLLSGSLIANPLLTSLAVTVGTAGTPGTAAPAVTGANGGRGGVGGGGGIIVVTENTPSVISYDFLAGQTAGSGSFAASSGYAYIVLNK
jgi:hypothetical protein